MNCNSEMVRMEDFSFQYKGNPKPSLRGINLTVRQGECLVLTGASGCGKTTMIRCMNGLIPDFFEGQLVGSCLVHGMEIADHETGDYAAHVGSVFQDPRSQFFTLHVNTEIPFPSENLGIPMEKIRQRYEQTVAELDISNLLEKSIFHLSSGEKQKIAIASVKTAGVTTYVLDEPSANLDSVGTEQLRQVLTTLKAQGHTIIVSEHKLHYLKNLADRVLVLHDGKIKYSLNGNEFRSQHSTWFLKNGLRQMNLDAITLSPADITTPITTTRLRAEELTFHYPGNRTLWKHVSFKCQSGEIVGIVGKNGAGKSTLIRVLMGLERPSSGRVYINDMRASKQKRQKQSFYVMQDVDYQLFAATVLEEMISGHEGEANVEQKARDILYEFELDNFLSVHPSRLSGGQKQRLSIALAMMSQVPFIFLDEPTSGLDAKNIYKVQAAIRKLAQSGCLVFVITHDYEFAAGIFTSLLVLQDNTIEAIDSTSWQPEGLRKYFE